MNLVDYIYLETPLRRRVCDLLLDFSYIVNTIVGSGIYLYHVHARPRRNGTAHLTLATWISVHRVSAVDRLCKYLCDRGLTCTSRSAEQVCMSYSVIYHLILERGHNMILPLDLVKGRWSPFSI